MRKLIICLFLLMLGFMTVSTRAATVFKLEKQLKITPLASNGDCDDDDDNDE